MGTKDRWFYAVGLVISVLPFSIMAMSLHFLPDRIPLLQILGPEIETVSKNRNIIIGTFCLVPVSAVLLVTYLRSRRLVDKHFYAVTVGAIAISLAFLSFVAYQLIRQAGTVEETLREFDYVGVISVAVSYIFALLGVPVYSIKPNEALGLRNSYTNQSPVVWERVHKHCGHIIIIGFTAVGTVISFLRGFTALAVLLSFVLLLLLYIVLYSKHVAKIVTKKAGSFENYRY